MHNIFTTNFAITGDSASVKKYSDKQSKTIQTMNSCVIFQANFLKQPWKRSNCGCALSCFIFIITIIIFYSRLSVWPIMWSTPNTVLGGYHRLKKLFAMPSTAIHFLRLVIATIIKCLWECKARTGAKDDETIYLCL